MSTLDKNANLRKMSEFLWSLVDTEYGIVKEPEISDAVHLSLDISLDKFKQIPVMWECGGSIGTAGTCISILDERMRTRIPVVIPKTINKYNGNQAMIAIHPGYHILGATYEEDKPYIVGLFRICEFKYNEETKKNSVEAVPIHISSYQVKDNFRAYLADPLSENEDSDEYVRDTHSWSHPATIILPKVMDYMARSPMHIKHWTRMIIDADEVVGLKNTDLANNATVKHTPVANLLSLYETLRKDALYIKQKYNIKVGMLLMIDRPSENVVAIRCKLVKKDNKHPLLFKDFHNDLIDIKTLYLTKDRLKNFWLPDMDPWYNTGLQRLQQILSLQEQYANTDLVYLHKYQLYSFVG